MSVESKRKELERLQNQATVLAKEINQEEATERQKHLVGYRPLACRAHEALCHWNHTDGCGCGWGYELDKENLHNWEAHTHRQWLEKIEKAVTKDGLTLDQISDVLTASETTTGFAKVLWSLK